MILLVFNLDGKIYIGGNNMEKSSLSREKRVRRNIEKGQ